LYEEDKRNNKISSYKSYNLGSLTEIGSERVLREGQVDSQCRSGLGSRAVALLYATTILMMPFGAWWLCRYPVYPGSGV
jgi:hypothetical protein